jgi:hypothetical protein
MEGEINKELIQAQYAAHAEQVEYMLDDILKRIEAHSSITKFEGNCFYYHLTNKRYEKLLPKQCNLFWCGQQAKTRICEIGFNAGHSAYLMLLGKGGGTLDFTVFDICEHSYTKPCLDYMKETFKDVKFDLIDGDSTKTMPAWISAHPESLESYDVVHVDGGHSEHCIASDLECAKKLVKRGGILIIDDTNMQVINQKVDALLKSNEGYQEITPFPTVGYQHRILRKN